MSLSVFDFFTIGIGPSSSHTVGPMRAARRFVQRLADERVLDRVARVEVELFGSLGHTGKGHGADRALVAGLEGETPEGVDVDTIDARVAAVAAGAPLRLLGRHPVGFDLARDLRFNRRESLPLHPNGMRFRAFESGGDALDSREYYSVGGGFVSEGEAPLADAAGTEPYSFASAEELLAHATKNDLHMSDVVLANERASRPEVEVRARLDRIWAAMQACAARGLASEGVLPGGLRLERRAPALARRLRERTNADPLAQLDWVNAFALAVNEENAAGGRVVTAPTNGAAGIVPAVLHYYMRFVPDANDAGAHRFLLVAGAIAMLYKRNASISGAEVGCQGEVGVASSMSAGALAEVLGGSPAQVENAAEIAMEHHLGLTCDPIGGLVQIPCIERNAMGAVKAINAARIALAGDGRHRVSLDKVIAVMRETGADMSAKYKETSRGGLAVNVVEC